MDATIVSVTRQRNTKEENETIKNGDTPKEWEKEPTKLAQKDVDARWTKKNDESFYGYKNHIGVDKAHKLIRKTSVLTDAEAVIALSRTRAPDVVLRHPGREPDSFRLTDATGVIFGVFRIHNRKL